MIRASTHLRFSICSQAARCWRSCSLSSTQSQRYEGLRLMVVSRSFRFTDLINSKILWAFSIWLESVAILPQLFMLQRTGEAETVTTHYLFALGMYRALYIPNWFYRYFALEKVDKIAWIAGVIQTVLYSDFFWIYYTK